MNKKNLIIIGAGGHGRVVADIAALCGTYERISFLDDAEHTTVPVIGKVRDYVKYIKDNDFMVAIGNNAVREKITAELSSSGANITTLIHPAASIGSKVQIGKGTVVMPGAVINTGATIGNGVIINTCSSVDHDCVVDDFCHISVGAHLAGTVRVGRRTLISAGATVIHDISICADSTIGAGAVLIQSVKSPGVYVGVPAKKIQE